MGKSNPNSNLDFEGDKDEKLVSICNLPSDAGILVDEDTEREVWFLWNQSKEPKVEELLSLSSLLRVALISSSRATQQTFFSQFISPLPSLFIFQNDLNL